MQIRQFIKEANILLKSKELYSKHLTYNEVAHVCNKAITLLGLVVAKTPVCKRMAPGQASSNTVINHIKSIFGM